MTIGNGIISGMDFGLHKNIVSSFTGDIVLVSQKQEGDNVFLDFTGKAVEPITNFLAINDILKSQDYIDKYVPIGKNMVMALNEEGGMPGYSYVIGANLKKYHDVFPSTLVPVEGRLMNNDEKGVLVPTGARQEMFENTGIWFKPEKEPLKIVNLPKENGIDPNQILVKDSVVLMGFNNNNTTSDIRLGIKGIVKFKALNRILGQFALMDIESYRTCLGYFSADDKSTVLSSDEKKLFNLGDEGLDALFSENPVENMKSERHLSIAPISPVQKLTKTAESKNVDAGAYNLVLIRLKYGEDLNKSAGQIK